jgi:hypothetical protein
MLTKPCTTGRNRNRTKLNNMNTSLSKHATENSRVSRLDKCVQFNFGVSSTDVGAGNMDECVHINGQEDARMGPDTQQWDNVTRQPPPVDHVRSPYITKTARKTVLHKERISAKSGSSHSEREQIPPWKPAAASKDKHKGFIGFSESSLPTDPLRLSNGQNTPETYENGIVNNRPTLRVTKTTGSVLDQIPTPNGKVGTETITLNKARTSPNTQTRTIVLNQSDDSREHHLCENENYSNDEFEDDSCESVTPMMSSEDEQQGKFPSTPSEVEATEHAPHVGVHKGTSLVSHLPPGLSSNELQYLSFVSTITKDVIARGVYTDVGLNMLFAEHIERNRDRLDLGEMNKRVQELRDKLNIKSTEIFVL